MLDTLLENRTHAVDERGLPIPITGLPALIQRLLIRLSVRKGSFLPDPQLGSELHRLAGQGEHANQMALHWAQQALLPEPEAQVLHAACRLEEDNCLQVAVTVAVGEQKYALEVKADEVYPNSRSPV